MTVARRAADVVDSWARADPDLPPLVVLDRLTDVLDEHGLGTGPVEVERLGDGHSNATFLVRRRAGSSVVLRRPPRPPWPPSTHDVLREGRVLRALRGAVPVPEVLACCDDLSVLGAPFVLMEHVEGDVVADALPASLEDPARRRSTALDLVAALAALHAVDPDAVGLGDLSRRDGYLQRQVGRFGGLWEHHRTRELPDVDRIASWLAEHLPRQGRTTVVHGDYRLGNVVLREGRVAAILDWEMAALGDPLADLGYLSALWVQADDSDRGALDFGGVTRLPGFPPRIELAEAYERATGVAADLRWYEVLALFKLLVFMEGNYARARAGGSDDPFALAVGTRLPELAARALEVARTP